MASSSSTTADDSNVEAKTHSVSWRVVRLSIMFTAFMSLVLLYVCTYFTVRSQLQQLRADVDQLKAVHSLSVKPAAEAGLLGDDNVDQLVGRRSKRHDAFNESAVRNDTSDNADMDDAGSGEVADNQYRGIWMGTYSRVPVSAVKEYCLAMAENCPAPSPGSPGVPGERGDPGESGPRGTKGERGATGVEGRTGPTGEQGEKGDKGETGSPGLDGIPGTDGVNGTDGQKGRRGRHGRQGDRGQKGDKGSPRQLLPNDTARLIRGRRGKPGPPGVRGPKGDQGAPGDSCGCITTETTTRLTTTVEPTVEPRLRDCRIRVIGKPLFHKSATTNWGMWLKDSNPHELLGEKFWLTKHFSGKSLYYYNSLENVKKDAPDGVYELTELYFGTGNVVYNGSYYYHREGYSEIIKFDLVMNNSTAKVEIPFAAYQGKDHLYKTEYSFFDLSVDENGLWAVYASKEEHNSLLVSKLNADDLTIEKTWHVPVPVIHSEYGNGFIACGLLYLIRDVMSTTTTIDYAYDLYTKQRRNVSLRFNNPYHKNTMIAFNHAERQIYSLDF